MLLEVIVALTILSTVSIAALTMSSESMRVVQHAREAEQRMRAASGFLEAVSLWPRAELDQRLGERSQGRWKLRINRTFPTLYEITLVDSAGGVELLRTSLFRPDGSRAIE